MDKMCESFEAAYPHLNLTQTSGGYWNNNTRIQFDAYVKGYCAALASGGADLNGYSLSRNHNGDTLLLQDGVVVDLVKVLLKKRVEPDSKPAKCPTCQGNDGSAPCAYPSEGKPGCLRDARLASDTAQELPPLLEASHINQGSFDAASDLYEAEFKADQEARRREKFEADLEAAYWEFDAKKKGYAQWKHRPQSERDAFKQTVHSLFHDALSAGSGEQAPYPTDDPMTALAHKWLTEALGFYALPMNGEVDLVRQLISYRENKLAQPKGRS